MYSPHSPAPAVAPLVSFADLFGLRFGDLDISRIEIPPIQRDYAQGRNSIEVSRIRDAFVTPLCRALLPGEEPVDLDFIFGDVGEDGQFLPLDGQQRLTTLFLLHCYLAWRTRLPSAHQPWSRFSYETRASARAFCAFLVREAPPLPVKVSDWIRDHADYLPTWDFDPTIQSMLTMLDTLHHKMTELGITDFDAALGRLLDPIRPAIRFYVLPVAASGLTNELYIKMNSRGKPLTRFENFKAHFEAVLTQAGHAQATHFALNVDTKWSNILWDYRGSDNVVDDEFMRYFRCITEINAWNAGIEFNAELRDDDLADMVYSAGHPQASKSVDFLFAAFNAWDGKDIKAEFESVLAPREAAGDGRVPLFKTLRTFEEDGVNLFAACCRLHGTRGWTLGHTLLLYGVLVEKTGSAPQPRFAKRMRILRNLIEASGDEIRVGERNTMPRLLAEVHALMTIEDLGALATFNQVQVRNEIAKAAMLREAPELEVDVHLLEDHDLLRGGLTAFFLESQHFAARTKAFLQLFDTSRTVNGQPYQHLTGSLLALGDYSRPSPRTSGYWLRDFGAAKNDEPWRDIFRGRKRETNQPVKGPLAALLDAHAHGTPLRSLVDRYLADSATRMDWRYYFVKYDAMRSGASGRYIIGPRAGYQVCMLNKEKLTSNYYDPYVRAIVMRSEFPRNRIGNLAWPYFTGSETLARALVLKNSNISIRSVDDGWEIGPPGDLKYTNAFSEICATCGIELVDDKWLLRIKQVDGFDMEDRIQKGETVLRALAIADL